MSDIEFERAVFINCPFDEDYAPLLQAILFCLILILLAYDDFQAWHYERQLAWGWSDGDIQDYPTGELLTAMQEWVAAGRPADYEPDGG